MEWVKERERDEEEKERGLDCDRSHFILGTLKWSFCAGA
jgi:hypothetical protein